MKTHVKGTNGRTVCGSRIGEKTQLVQNDKDATCQNCLYRCFQEIDLIDLVVESRDFKNFVEKTRSLWAGTEFAEQGDALLKNW